MNEIEELVHLRGCRSALEEMKRMGLLTDKRYEKEKKELSEKISEMSKKPFLSLNCSKESCRKSSFGRLRQVVELLSLVAALSMITTCSRSCTGIKAGSATERVLCKFGLQNVKIFNIIQKQR